MHRPPAAPIAKVPDSQGVSLPTLVKSVPHNRGEPRSSPSSQNGFRFDYLFGRTSEVVLVFSSATADEDFDGVQAVIFHPQAELFVDLGEPVLLEAFAHVGASVRTHRIAM